MSFLLLFLFTSLANAVIGDEVRISNVDEFIQFKDNVNKGTNYSGTTVFLDADLSLAEKAFEPIGYYHSRLNFSYFSGVFDGQGHVISNFKVASSSLEHIGLFGFSYGLTIRNVILDSSCSIASSLSGYDDVYLGGVIGECYAYKGSCFIENSVNMGSVSFTGTMSKYYDLYIGGIAGELYPSEGCVSVVKNCANYGDITHSGTNGCSYVGGVVGHSYGGSPSDRVYIQNSLNHGAITHSGASLSKLYLGGVAGDTRYTTIESCVSAGEISSSNESYIGSIVGYIYYGTSVSYCYAANELSSYSKYGYVYSTPSESNALSYNSTTFELDEIVSVGSYTGTSLIDALNAAADYYVLRDYSHWLINKNNHAVTFAINNDRAAPISMGYQIMLLPSLASEGNMNFNGWYEDSDLTASLASYEIASDTVIYGKWVENTKSYTVTFNTRKESVYFSPTIAKFGSVVKPPSLTVNGCGVGFWENKYGDNIGLNFTMPAHDLIIYAVWKCTRIKTPEDLVDFSKVVNGGADSFYEATVFLDSDLSLDGKAFEPIGNYYYSNYFLGTFDGQGHVISDLTVNSSSQYVGLFGYSGGPTIKNVILDSSCSVTSSFSDPDDAYVGGIIGWYKAYNIPCAIENSVNLASVSFTGTIADDSLYLGGIAGYVLSSNHEPIVKNCANYGGVTHVGQSNHSYIGGIAGYSSGELIFSSVRRVYIYNSLNYGTIAHSGTTSNNLYLGGAAGCTYYTNIENYVSAGEISSNKEGCTGSIVGNISSSTIINYCYATSEFKNYDKYGQGIPSNESYTTSYDSTTFEFSTDVSVGSYTGTSVIDALNAASEIHAGCSRWLLNKNKNTVTFAINNKTVPISLSYQIILLPSLASEGSMSFDGWYEDSALTKKFTLHEVTESTALYGRWEKGINYTITFDFNNGTMKSVAFPFNAIIEYPEGISEREGFTFIGWSPEPETMPAENITIKAQWRITSPKECVEIVFSSSVSDDVIEDIVKELVPEGAEFNIESLDRDFKGKNVIVKFMDKETAADFVEKVIASSGAKKSDIQAFGFVSCDNSFASSLSLNAFVYFMSHLVSF